MTGQRPLAVAWNRVRNTVEAMAAARRDDAAVVTAFADHAGVRSADADGVTFAFTVPGDVGRRVTAAVEAAGESAEAFRTHVQYSDVDATRLFVLETRSADRVVLLAGGIRHDALTQGIDPDEPARTVVRHVDGTEAARFTHDHAAPFLADLG